MKRLAPLIAAALLAAPAPDALAATPINETRPASASARIEVSNVRGGVTVTGWERNEVEIKGSLGEGSKLDISGGGDNLKIEVRSEEGGGSGWSWWGSSGPREDTRLDIRVPRAAAIDVDSVSADVRVEGIEGSAAVEVDSVSGDVRVDARSERLTLGSVSGDLAMRGSARRSELESVSGDINADGVSEDLKVESVSGSVVIAGPGFSSIRGSTVSGDLAVSGALAEGARVDLESMSGDVDLNVSGELSARIEVETFSGSIRSDWGTVEKEDHGPGASLRTTAGSGSATVTLESFSGDVTVRKGGG